MKQIKWPSILQALKYFIICIIFNGFRWFILQLCKDILINITDYSNIFLVNATLYCSNFEIIDKEIHYNSRLILETLHIKSGKFAINIKAGKNSLSRNYN